MTEPTIQKRPTAKIRQNIAANTLMSGVMLIYPIACVPVLISSWGVERYGEWLILLSVTSYFQLADLGLNTSTANSVVIARLNGQLARVRSLVLNNILFISATFALLLAIVAIALKLEWFTSILGNTSVLDGSLDSCVLMVLFQTYIGMLTNLLGGLYRANDSYATGVMVDNFIRISEYAVSLSLAMMGGAALIVLQGGVIVKCLGLLVKAMRIQTQMKRETRYSAIDLSLSEVRCELRPSLAFVMFPVSGMVTNSAPLLIINATLGSTMVVLFGTMRTFVNTSKVFVDIVQRSIWPEITRLYAVGQIDIIQNVYHRTLLFAVGVSAAVAVPLLLWGGAIYNSWTGNATSWDAPLGIALAFAGISSSASATGTMVLQAMNAHQKIAYITLASTAIGVFLLVTISLTFPIEYIPCSHVASEVAIAYFAHKLIRRTLAATSNP